MGKIRRRSKLWRMLDRPGGTFAAHTLSKAQKVALRRLASKYGGPLGSVVDRPAAAVQLDEASRSIRPIHTPFDFAAEWAAYRKQKPLLLVQSPGRFFVFVGNRRLGPFDRLGSAVVAGRREFGQRPIFVKQITDDEPVIEIGAL